MRDRLLRIAALATALLVLGAAAPRPAEYPARADELGPETRAICQQAAGAQPPAADWPTPSEVRALKGCSSEALYYGIGRKADPVKARKCALLEWRAAPSEPDEFRRGGLLMMTYANGRGGRRNIDLAIHMLCGMSSAPVDTRTLVKALAERKAKGDRSEFDYCGEVELGLSNVSLPACDGLETRKKRPRWEARMRTVEAKLGARGRDAYRRLRAQEAALIAARGAGETAAGAIHRGDASGFEDEIMEDDVGLLQRLAAGDGLRASSAARVAAERRLAAEYEAFLASVDEQQSPIGGLYRGGVSRSQTAWTAYRDSWLAFVQTAWPRASSDGVAQHLAERRTRMLKCVAFGDSDQQDEALQKLCS